MRLMVTRSALLFAVVSAFLPQAITPAAAQEARFRVTVSWMQHEIEPRQQSRPTSSTYLVTLRGNTVHEEFVHRAGRRARGIRQASRETALGEDMNGRFTTKWTVISQNTLLRVAARPSHTFAIWLRTDGTRSCTALAEWRLKPGHSVYETWAPKRRVKMLFSEPTEQSAECEVL
ncbi:hypothetical protein [Bosea vestrisii]|uniref:Uncharacterized protein n=1 Tax=Bosea vestrisii TaxID=151416 RepID=A0ABW0HFE7_9HYPH